HELRKRGTSAGYRPNHPKSLCAPAGGFLPGATAPGLARRSRCLPLQRALADHRDELRLRHWARERITLPHVASHAMNGLQVGGLLEACGDRNGAEMVRKVDDRLADAGIGRIVRAILHEAAVELELGERHLAQPGKGGKPFPEIVDRERDAVDA